MANCNFPTYTSFQASELFPQSQAAPVFPPPAQTPSFFPQPQGSVFMIGKPNELSNIPVGNGISAAISLQEGIMFLKAMQNGVPVSVAYRLAPYEGGAQKEETEPTLQSLVRKIEQLEERLSMKKSGGKSEWLA